MAVFIVTMTHPDGDGWDRHVVAHVEYLLKLVRDGPLIASGPLKGTHKCAGFLIFQAADRSAVERLVAEDPFAKEGLIVSLDIEEWDPLFGALASRSSQILPEAMRPLMESGAYP